MISPSPEEFERARKQDEERRQREVPNAAAKAGDRTYHVGRSITLANPTPAQLEQAQREFERDENFRRRFRATESKVAEAKSRPKFQPVLKMPATAAAWAEPDKKPKKEHPKDSQPTYTDTYVWESEAEKKRLRRTYSRRLLLMDPAVQAALQELQNQVQLLQAENVSLNTRQQSLQQEAEALSLSAQQTGVSEMAASLGNLAKSLEIKVQGKIVGFW